ncbi:hypothetical protein MLD38_014781 [Melastoma candidum]|uniref:Uncharacterized protein n=1 Tax=Melastoma candidum TaxID=119954 RepID=A0ACB9RDX2_9MYRT|nr:hypothetical protein MLD38_014781 [Melastoma candidum]
MCNHESKLKLLPLADAYFALKKEKNQSHSLLLRLQFTGQKIEEGRRRRAFLFSSFLDSFSSMSIAEIKHPPYTAKPNLLWIKVRFRFIGGADDRQDKEV